MIRISRHVVCAILSIAFLGLVVERAAAQAVMDPAEFKPEAKRLGDDLNKWSTYASDTVKYTEFQLGSLNSSADKIEGYDPSHPNTQPWRDDYGQKRLQFAADRANHETAMIKFRDLAAYSHRFLDLNDRNKDSAAYQDLRRALLNADAWISYYDTQWKSKEALPRALRDAAAGKPPELDGGRPVLEAHRLTAEGAIDVNGSRAVNYRFTNNDPVNRIWFSVQLVEVDANGAAVEQNVNGAVVNHLADLSIDPDGWSAAVMLDPGRSVDLGWTVTVNSQREFTVGARAEISRYMPVR